MPIISITCKLSLTALVSDKIKPSRSIQAP